MRYIIQVIRHNFTARIGIFLFTATLFAQKNARAYPPENAVMRGITDDAIIFSEPDRRAAKIFQLPKGMFINLSFVEKRQPGWIISIFGYLQLSSLEDVSSEFESFEFNELEGACDFSRVNREISCKTQDRTETAKLFKYLANTPILLGEMKCNENHFTLRILRKFVTPKPPPGPYYTHYVFTVSKKDRSLRQISIQIQPWECNT